MMKKAFLTLSLLFALFSSLAMPALAQDNPTDDGPDNAPVNFQIKNPFKVGDNLFQLMENILKNIVIPIGGMLCVLAFIWGGFQFVMAQGNEKKLTSAKTTLLYATIGTVLILGAWVIEELIRSTLTSVLKT